jgi:hypothetical protein
MKALVSSRDFLGDLQGLFDGCLMSEFLFTNLETIKPVFTLFRPASPAGGRVAVGLGRKKA